MDHRPIFKKCPHCGEHGYEKLITYSHCVSCLFVKEHKKKIKESKNEKKEKALERKRENKEKTLMRKQERKEKELLENNYSNLTKEVLCVF